MRVPLSWLKDFVDIDVAAAEIASRLSLSGLETTVSKFGSRVDGLKTVKILSVSKHPSRDRLNVCLVGDGVSTYQVITAADNIQTDDIVVFAPVGTKLPDRYITEVEFAGVKSQGMLVSLEDLNLEDRSEGIFILDKDTPAGIDANDVLSLGEDILEIEITPNRGDCLSIKGVAREVCAVFGLKKKEVSSDVFDFPDIYPVEVITDNCNRYIATVVRDISVKPSPLHIRLRLIKAGLSCINNIVDITNYIMVQEGQPLHAFDLDKVQDRIVVRQAKDGEKIITLDGFERELSAEDVVIADSSKPIAIAGVIGGEETKITGTTKNILIEIASFNPVSVRKTAKRLGLSTDSSYRFERGVDITACGSVKDKAVSMAILHCGGGLAAGADVYPVKYTPKKVYLNPQKIEKVLGSKIDLQETVKILNSLDIPSVEEQNTIVAEVPAHRSGDISRDIDLVEEIARIKGYDTFEPSYPKLSLENFKPDKEVGFFNKTREFFTDSGFTEVLNYTFTSEEFYRNISLETPPIRIENYILKSQSVMRDTVLAGLFTTIQENLRFGQKDLAVFEVSSVFFKDHEEIRLGVVATGKMTDGYSFYDGKTRFSTTKVWDFLAFKGIIDNYLKLIGVDYKITQSSRNFLHPYQSADIHVGDKPVGYFGRLHPQVAERFEYPENIYVAELTLKYVPRRIDEEQPKEGYLLTHYINRKPPLFREIPKYPPAKRDLAFVVDSNTPEGEFERDLISSHRLVWKVKLFDVYYVSTHKKSLAYTVEFLSVDRSLSDEEVNLIVDEILATLKLKYSDLSLRS